MNKTLKELLENSGIIKPSNIKPKNNVLGDWDEILNLEKEKIKFEKCQEHRQIGYLCDAHPTCASCQYQISNELYVKFGGKLII